MSDGKNGFKLNGNTWRLITPILLCVVTGLQTTTLWTMSDFRNSIARNMDKIENNTTILAMHEKNPDIHYNIKNRLDWIEDFVKENRESQKKSQEIWEKRYLEGSVLFNRK